MLSHFSGNLYCALETGHIIVIGGRSIDSASRIDLNLTGGKNEANHVPLHISIRFHEDAIVRNSKVDGEWGVEEREENLHHFAIPNPIVAGDTFQFYIFVGDDRFHISINGAPFCTYSFRLPIEEIRTVTVDKDVQSINQIDHRQAFPSPYPLIQTDNSGLCFSNDIPKPITPGHIMVITGIPFGSPKGVFIIRFCEGDTKKQALHFNPRFEHKAVIRNSMNDNLGFLNEERDGGFPFVIDQQFKLAIAFTEHDFRFAVNGNYFARYAYRSANVLDRLNGFKAHSGGGLSLEITGVDHLHMGLSDCDGFESYSHPDICLY